MQYPDGPLTKYDPFTRMMGTYETEIWPFIETVKNRKYHAIVDIGSGDGYYAVGLGLMHPEAKIHAFDQNPKSNAYLLTLAQKNGVTDRLSQGEFCDPATLMALDLGNRSLIFCDCEGYEKQLFTKEVAEHLRPHDIIIETHDLKNMEITPHLRSVFADTHDLQVVRSLDDIHKVNDWDYPELDGYSRHEKHILYGERRRAAMEWFFLSSKRSR